MDIKSSQEDSRSSFDYKTYQSYVSDLAIEYPEYQWLSDFLSYPGAQPSETTVLITDSVGDGELQTREFGAPFSSSGVSHSISMLSHSLRTRPENVRTRIVHVTFRQSWSIDREAIDIIGLHFRIDPMFFWGSLDHYFASEDRTCPYRDRQSQWTDQLPSEQKFIQLACVNTGLSALLLKGRDAEGYGNTGSLMFLNIFSSGPAIFCSRT